MKNFHFLLGKTKRTIKNQLRWNRLWVLMAATSAIIAVSSVLVISNVTNIHYNQSIDESTVKYNVHIVENVSKSIDGYLEEMVNVSNSLTEFVQNKGVSPDIADPNPFILRSDINTIAVFDSNGKLILKTNEKPLKGNASIVSQSWFRSVPPGSRNYHISAPHVQCLYQGEYPWVLSLCKGLSWKENGKTCFGTILVDLNFNSIKGLCSELGKKDYIFILGEDNELIYHPNQQMIYYGIGDKINPSIYQLNPGNSIITVDDQRMAVCVKKLNSTNWRVVGVSPLNGLFSIDSEIKNFITIALFLSTFLIAVLSILISLLITRPIRNLIKLMGKVEGGEMDAFAQVSGTVEVQELSRSFNNMVYRIKRLMGEIVHDQQQLRKSETKTLYAQINPHFLYNTLDSIVWMAESGDNPKVVKMIFSLAQFFRLSLSGGRDTITVEQEMKHAETYLTLQKMRFSDQFTYEIQADPDVLQCKTLKIVLQPILENSVIHGVGDLPYQGKIIVKAARDGDMLVFQVIDNGFGIEPEKLAKILEIDQKSKSGIGIKNVNGRIQLQYGSQYGLHYESELDEGTTVTIRLPYVK